MKALVIGASGQVGSHLVQTLIAQNCDVRATYHSHQIPDAAPLDITKVMETNALITSSEPDVIYLPGAFPNVDYCETHPEETYEINVRGVKNVVDAANQTNARLVYFSSEYIFDGISGPYTETDIACPISEYGRQKLFAEHYISLFSKNHLIVRTTVVFGWEWQGKNFIIRLINSLKDKRSIRVPADQISSPTYVNNLAQIVVELSLSDFLQNEVINVTGPDCLSRYDLAVAAAQAFGLDASLITPVSTAELNQPAKRPLQAGLKIDKLIASSNIPPTSHHDGLLLMAKQHPIT